VETRIGENHGEKEKESTITMAITIVFSSLLGFLRLNLFYVGRGLPFIQVVSVG